MTKKDIEKELEKYRVTKERIVKTMEDEGANTILFDKGSTTLLMHAAKNLRDPELMQTLIDAGADSEARDEDEEVTVFESCFVGMEPVNPECVKVVLEQNPILSSEELAFVSKYSENRDIAEEALKKHYIKDRLMSTGTKPEPSTQLLLIAGLLLNAENWVLPNLREELGKRLVRYATAKLKEERQKQ